MSVRTPGGYDLCVVEFFRNGDPPIFTICDPEWQPAVTEPDRNRTLLCARRGIHSLDFDGEVK